MESVPALQLWACVYLSHSDAEGNLTRLCGKRHSFSHSVDLMSKIMVENEAVIRMITKDRRSNLRHVSRTCCFDLDSRSNHRQARGLPLRLRQASGKLHGGAHLE